ncbi:MAG TPA: manganese efflux pump MntP family protein [Bacteroidales bacterium]|nr:manganese efflux pump MntP family protein [Bacteroidales bacterium]
MDFLTIFLIAVGLSMDSFAVSITSGLVLNQIDFKKASRIAFSLGFFQALMPTIGWFIGVRIQTYIENFDHWIAFGLLFIIGLKMILESLKKDEDDRNFNPLNPKVLLVMSLATSIDALVAGISFAFSEYHWFLSAVVIGATTFVISMLGILFGKKVGHKFGSKMEILGGAILIFIGVKILFEHLGYL